LASTVNAIKERMTSYTKSPSGDFRLDYIVF
jgi:hypothetical protein